MRTALKHKITLILMSGLLCPLISFGQDSLNVRKKGELPTLASARDIVIRDTLIFVASKETGLRIMSTADPDTILEIGYYETPGWAYDIELRGNYVYIADGNNFMRIIDVSNPRAPSESGYYSFSFNDPEEPNPSFYRVEVRDSLAFVCGWYHGVHVINVSDPRAPFREVILFPWQYVTDVTFRDSLMFVSRRSSGVQILDASNPLAPVSLGWYSTADGDDIDRVTVVDTLMFAAVEERYEEEYVHIVNIADPSSPQYISSLSSAHAIGWRVNIHGQKAFTTSNRGIDVFLVENPFAPVWLGNWGVPSERCCSRFVLVGDTAYLALGAEGVQIWDAGDSVGVLLEYDPVSYIYDTEVIGDQAFVADISWGVAGINVSDPANPTEFWRWRDEMPILGVEGNDNWLFLLGWRNVLAFDIVSNRQPFYVNSVWLSFIQNYMVLLGDFIWARDSNFNLRIIDVSNPDSGLFVTRSVETLDAEFVMYNVPQARLVYSIRRTNTLGIWNNVTPSLPFFADSLVYEGSSLARLKIQDSLLIGISSSGDGHIFSLADPYHPEWISTVIGMRGSDIETRNQHVVTLGGSRRELKVWDMDEPQAAFLTGNRTFPGQDPKALELLDDSTVLVAGYHHFEILDISEAMRVEIMQPADVTIRADVDSLRLRWNRTVNATNYTLWSSSDPNLPLEFYTQTLSTPDTFAALPLPADPMRVYFVTAE